MDTYSLRVEFPRYRGHLGAAVEFPWCPPNHGNSTFGTALRDGGLGESGGRDAHFGGAVVPPGKVDLCRVTRLRRFLSGISDAVTRLKAALEGRYAIERLGPPPACRGGRTDTK